VGTSTGIYAVGGAAIVLAVVFVLAVLRCAARADRCSEQLLVECLREQARVLQSAPAMTIEARRIQAHEVSTRLSRRRTWRQPSSA